MKKFFIISVLAAIFGLTSCTGEGDEIVGTWEAEKLSMTADNGMVVEVPLAQAGMEMEITFKSNGEGYMKMTSEGERTSGSFTYTLNGTRLTMTSEGEPLSFPISIVGDNMTFELKKEFTGEDYDMALHFVRK